MFAIRSEAIHTRVIVVAENKFPTWLAQELRRREWTQSDFARRMKIGTGSVAMWMTGTRNPSPRSLDRIADVLAVDVDFLLTLAGHRPKDLGGEDDIIKRELLPLMRQIDWSRGLALDAVKSNLEFWRGAQAKEHER